MQYPVLSFLVAIFITHKQLLGLLTKRIWKLYLSFFVLQRFSDNIQVQTHCNKNNHLNEPCLTHDIGSKLQIFFTSPKHEITSFWYCFENHIFLSNSFEFCAHNMTCMSRRSVKPHSFIHSFEFVDLNTNVKLWFCLYYFQTYTALSKAEGKPISCERKFKKQ